MTAMMRVPRTRGAGSGLLLILLGVWGALIPFVGPYFHFAYTPDTAWTWTWGRFFLDVVPGVATALGGLILTISAFRPVAMFGAALAGVDQLLHAGRAGWRADRAQPGPADRRPAAHGGRAPGLLHRPGRGHRVPRRPGLRPPGHRRRARCRDRGRPGRGGLVQAAPL